MDIIDVPLGDISPYPNNPRINGHAIDGVVASIREFGFQQPIVCDEDFVIIAGHTRYEAARQMGLELVPVVIARGLTAEQVRAYRIADNATAELAEWDMEKLSLEIQGLDGTIDLAGMGFESEELGRISEEGEERGRAKKDNDNHPFRIGRYWFDVKPAEYRRWMNSLRQMTGDDDKKMVSEIKRRLEIL